MEKAIELISKERERQINVKGYDINHDDKECNSQLAYAACCYAVPECSTRKLILNWAWKWNLKYWKPTPDNRIKELVKAGALIVAEIERLQRLNKLL